MNDAAFFMSHRLPIALKVLEKGGSVNLFVGVNLNSQIEIEAINKLKNYKIECHRLCFSQGLKNPINEITGLFQLIKRLKKFSPTTVHSATVKGNLFASIACQYIGMPRLVLSISGMGTLFTGKISPKKVIFRFIYKFFLKRAFKKLDYKIIFQNTGDLDLFKTIINFNNHRSVIVPGSGIDTRSLRPKLPSPEEVKVLLPARMLYEKGVEEFVKASRLLKTEGIEGIFYLAGDYLSVNPSAISLQKLKNWEREGLISYLGYKSNVFELYEGISIVCLPSWREGFPKVLMEAAAFGIPVITTDIPGCRDAVIKNKTGLLVPVGDHLKLAGAIKKLITNKDLRKKLGENNRKHAVKNFDFNKILPPILSLYI